MAATDIAGTITATYDASIPVPGDGDYANQATLINMVKPLGNRVAYLKARLEDAPWITSEVWEDFVAERVAVNTVESMWDGGVWNTSGAGINANYAVANVDEADAAGVVRFRNTSGNASEQRFRKGFDSYRFGNFRRFVCRVKTGNIDSGSNLEVGMLRATDATPGDTSVPSAAITVVLLPGTSPNFQLRTDDGAGSTYLDSGIPAAVDIWYELEIEYDGAGVVTIYIDGVQIGTKSTDIPAATATGTVQWKFASPNSGATRDWYFDFIYARFEYAARVT